MLLQLLCPLALLSWLFMRRSSTMALATWGLPLEWALAPMVLARFLFVGVSGGSGGRMLLPPLPLPLPPPVPPTACGDRGLRSRLSDLRCTPA